MDLFYFSGGPRERVLSAVLAAGHTVRHVFVNDPARWPKVRPTIDVAESAGIAVSVIRKKADVEMVTDVAAGGICLSAGFTYIFSRQFIDKVRICINVHGSLLPKFAGARTLSWAIVDGEVASGVTVHRVDEGVDTGAILLQRSFPLSPFETTRSLARKTGDLEPSVVVDALALYEARGETAFQPQPIPPLPLRPNRIPAHSELDSGRPLRDLVNDIRAADPDAYPAYFYHHGEKVCIRLWRPDKPAEEADLI
jgi:methionyl-tRNA formyltransferase